MKKEDKELLLKDLCARLPYGVKIDKVLYGATTLHERDIESFRNGFVDILKPYLRPMSAITDEEYNEYLRMIHEENSYTINDYLNSIHVDYRGLIEKGLALVAPEGMYNN